MGDNAIPNNPDETTYDPQAVNWINTSSYVDAAEKYVSGYCEERKVVQDGKLTGDRKRVCVDGIVTWTPADVTAAQGRGGLVSVVSTKEYSSQMPHVIIGIRKWNQQNRETVVKMLSAFMAGGDQVLQHPRAPAPRRRDLAGDLPGEGRRRGVLGEVLPRRHRAGQDGAAGGAGRVQGQQPGRQPPPLRPGAGELAGDFALPRHLHGVRQDRDAAVPQAGAQRTAGRLDPGRVVPAPGRRSARALRARRWARRRRPTYTPTNEKVTRVVGRRDYKITFQTGSAQLSPEGERQLQELFDNLSINSLAVEVHGHTDNTGSADANQQLSEDRAMAVKKYLEGRSASTFPQGRVRIFAHGATEPVESNRTEAGRSANRRVEVVIGN
jgi:outer membrane protein OmpA-like peptidoglycan-associated protein